MDLPAGVTLDAGRNNLSRVTIRTDVCDAEMYAHGAHVTHFHPRGAAHPVLWISASSNFSPGKPIRGGVPICFPWFGPKSDDSEAPAHGFARVHEWTLEDARQTDDGATRVAMRLTSNDTTRAAWPVDFEARHVVTFDTALRMDFTVTNNSPSLARCEVALHSYFTVGDIRQVEVRGLENAAYLDRLRPGERFRQDDRPIRFAGETDRTYVGTPAAVTVVDPALGRHIRIEKAGSRSTVVWNPWINKAKAMPDFGDDEWPVMLCIETANVGEDAMVLAPGESHTTTAVISLAPR